MPPANLEAEQALLGAILVNNEACDRVSSFLTPDHFAEGLHARIFDVASGLIRMGKLANPLTLKSFFEADQTLQDIGGTAYLSRLAASATTIINAEEYGRTIYELAQRRKLTLVNIVDNASQAENLRTLGAAHVLDSSVDFYQQQLVSLCAALGVNVAIDASLGPKTADLLRALPSGGTIIAHGLTPPMLQQCKNPPVLLSARWLMI